MITTCWLSLIDATTIIVVTLATTIRRIGRGVARGLELY